MRTDFAFLRQHQSIYDTYHLNQLWSHTMYRRLILPGGVLTLAALALAMAPRHADAALAHRYSFSGNVNDSVGTAHGTLVDAGAPTATFTGGQLDLSGNVGNGSNAIVEDAY